MNAYRITDGDGSATMIAHSFTDALEGWREWRKREADEGDDTEPHSIEALESEVVLVHRDALEVLNTSDKHWPATAKGVLWDVVGVKTLELSAISEAPGGGE